MRTANQLGMQTRLVPTELLDRILEIAIVCGLISIERRPLLFASIPREYIYSLPQHTIPLDQIRSDLLEMNTTPSLRGFNESPLVIWLKNAARLASPHPESVFFEAIARDLTSGGLMGNEE